MSKYKVGVCIFQFFPLYQVCKVKVHAGSLFGEKYQGQRQIKHNILQKEFC